MGGAGHQQDVRETLHGTEQRLARRRNVLDDAVFLWECLEPFPSAKHTDVSFGQNSGPYCRE